MGKSGPQENDRTPVAHLAPAVSESRPKTALPTTEAAPRVIIIRLSLRCTAKPLSTRFNVIFSSCISGVTIEFIPSRAGDGHDEAEVVLAQRRLDDLSQSKSHIT